MMFIDYIVPPGHFIDEHGTEFIKGPFEIEGAKYDYKLQENGLDEEKYIDYCSIQQLESWKVLVEKVIR